ncbi:cytochrome bd oxidase small subunit CydS [Alkalicoccus urumqiensis]|nr:hypothetical protein [Alkalicoccus urumqiensis]
MESFLIFAAPPLVIAAALAFIFFISGSRRTLPDPESRKEKKK